MKNKAHDSCPENRRGYRPVLERLEEALERNTGIDDCAKIDAIRRALFGIEEVEEPQGGGQRGEAKNENEK